MRVGLFSHFSAMRIIAEVKQVLVPGGRGCSGICLSITQQFLCCGGAAFCSCSLGCLKITHPEPREGNCRHSASPSWCTMAGRHCCGFSGACVTWQNSAKEPQQAREANPRTVHELCAEGQIMLGHQQLCYENVSSAGRKCWSTLSIFMHESHLPLAN